MKLCKEFFLDPDRSGPCLVQMLFMSTQENQPVGSRWQVGVDGVESNTQWLEV